MRWCTPEWERNTSMIQRRRDLLKSILIGITTGVSSPGTLSLAQSSAVTPATVDDRSYWVALVQKLATPVLTGLSRRELKKTMPVEAKHPEDRVKYAHLEGFGRLLAGIAPWLAARGLDRSEIRLQQNLLHLAQGSLA